MQIFDVVIKLFIIIALMFCIVWLVLSRDTSSAIAMSGLLTGILSLSLFNVYAEIIKQRGLDNLNKRRAACQKLISAANMVFYELQKISNHKKDGTLDNMVATFNITLNAQVNNLSITYYDNILYLPDSVSDIYTGYAKEAEAFIAILKKDTLLLKEENQIKINTILENLKEKIKGMLDSARAELKISAKKRVND